jgi:hypothetical protein
MAERHFYDSIACWDRSARTRLDYQSSMVRPLLPARAGARAGHGRAPRPHRTLLEAEALRLRKTPTSHAGRGSIGRSTSVGAGVQTRAVERSVFLVKDGTGNDETPSLARNGQNQPICWPVRDAAPSVPVYTPARGIPAVPDGTGTELTSMVLIFC